MTHKILQSIIVSLTLSFFTAHPQAAEKSPKEKDVKQHAAVPRRQLVVSDENIKWALKEEEERLQQEEWVKQQSPFSGYDSSSSEEALTNAMGKLGIDERPLAFGQRAYIESPEGITTFSSYTNLTDSLIIKDFGLQPRRLSYVANDNAANDNREHRETFTPTLERGETYKASRNHPFDAFSLTIKGLQIDFDAGHGIDQADTVLANGRNSSTDPDNFVPQNRFYNQHIRNPLVNHIVRKYGKGSYKEISVYDPADPLTHKLSNGQTCRIPIGFIFIVFENHKVKRAFYFPNLISYRQLISDDKIEKGYKNFINYFEIPKGTLTNEAVKVGDTDKHTRVVNDHASKAHGFLSGDLGVVDHIDMPKPAKAALQRLLAIYHMEQAGHLEYRCVEQKAKLVEKFTSPMKYQALDKTTTQEEEQWARNFRQACQKEQPKLRKTLKDPAFSLVDYANQRDDIFGTRYPANDPREIALKRVQELHRKPEPGQSLYDLNRALTWLARIEDTVKTSPKIEDIIRLLGLYDIPEVQDGEKRKHFENLLERQGAKGTLEEQKDVGDYFFAQAKVEGRAKEAKRLQQKVEKWAEIVEQRVAKSTSVREVAQAADWFYKGRGMFSQDLAKARKLYKQALPYASESGKERINSCLTKLSKIEASLKQRKEQEGHR